MLRTGLAIAAAVAALDQLVKLWVIGALSDIPGGVEVTPFLNIVMVWNRGISFGILGGAALPPWLLAALAGLVAAGLCWWLAGVRERLTAIGIALVIGGAVGNIGDRLRLGAVVDFLDLHAGGVHWPAFNVADTAISLGVAALLIDALPIGRGKNK